MSQLSKGKDKSGSVSAAEDPQSARSARSQDGGDDNNSELQLSDASSDGYQSDEDVVKKVPIPSDLRPWKEDKRVVQFLVKIGEARNARRIFDENEVDFETLMILSDEMLADMGLKLSTREKILQAVAKIREQDADDKLALYEDDDVEQGADDKGDGRKDQDTLEIVEMLSSAKAKDLSAGLKRVRQMAQVDPNLLNRAQIVNKLLEVLRSGSTFPSLGKPQKEALGIIYLLSKVDANKGLLSKGNVISSLAEILAVASDERNTKTALLALKTLQEMMNSPANLRVVRETGGLPRSLLKLVQLRAPGVQEAALDVLFTLAYENGMIQGEIVKASGIEVLSSIIVDTEPPENFKVKGLAARTLGVLASGVIPNRFVQDTVSDFTMGLLVQMARSSDEYQQMGGATAVGYFSDSNAQKKFVVLNNNAVDHMVQLLSSPNVDVQQAAARAVRGLARSDALGVTSRKKKGLFGGSGRKHVKRVDVAVKNILYHSGAVLSLASLLHSGKKAMREDALSALFELGRDNAAIQEQVFQSVNAPPLVEALGDSSINIQYYALGLLWYLINNNPPRSHAFLRAGVLEPLNRLQASQNQSINDGAVACFIELQRTGASLLNYSSYVS